MRPPELGSVEIASRFACLPKYQAEGEQDLAMERRVLRVSCACRLLVVIDHTGRQVIIARDEVDLGHITNRNVS